MAIGAIIGILSSVFSVVRALTPAEPPPSAQPSAADKLFAKLDTLGQGEISAAQLHSAFAGIEKNAPPSTDKLFNRLDKDGDGRITRAEFSTSVDRLAGQLDEHYQRLRLQGDGAMGAVASADAGFTRSELSGQLANLLTHFDQADSDGDGRVSLKEARAFAVAGQGAEAVGTAGAVGGKSAEEVELMLQVVRLMQAYGVVGQRGNDAGGVSEQV